jgi:hypothetical protein
MSLEDLRAKHELYMQELAKKMSEGTSTDIGTSSEIIQEIRDTPVEQLKLGYSNDKPGTGKKYIIVGLAVIIGISIFYFVFMAKKK